MASTAANISPQSNLKDRIAALQRLNHQNNTSLNNLAAANVVTGSQPSPSRGTLKDKIAKFEKRGGTPIPRGSFGMGAPPPDDGASKKKGELYGNRVAGLNRPNGPPSTFTAPRSPPPSTSTPSSPRTRRVSASSLNFMSNEIGSDVTSRLVSPAIPGKLNVEDATKDGSSPLVDDIPDSGYHSATTPSRRATIAFGRHSVSDAYSTYGVPTQASKENESSDPKFDSSPILVEGDATEANHFCEPVPMAESPTPAITQEEKIVEDSESLPIHSSTSIRIASPARAYKVPSYDSLPSATSMRCEPLNVADNSSLQQSVTVSTFSTSLSSQIPPKQGNMEIQTPVRDIASNQDEFQVASVSVASSKATKAVNPTISGTTSADPVVEHVSSNTSGAGVVTVHTEVTSAMNPAALAPSSASTSSLPPLVPRASLSEPATPLSLAPRSSSESKPVGELQPKLRKKMYPNSGPGFQEPSLTPKSGRKSFTAVVHRKMDEPSLKKTFDVPNAVSVAHITAAPATPSRVRTLTHQEALPPSSPGTGELALLVAEAALLERQLFTDGSSNEDYPDPDYPVPLFTRPTLTTQSSSSPVSELIKNDASSEQTDPTRSNRSIPYPVPTVREVGDDDEVNFDRSISAKSSRSRKLSSRIKSLASASSSTLRSLASSTYSRPSISSELSSEESAREPSPLPSTPREDNSIGGSSGSSFKWSSPKRNPLSRATSFADKIMNRAGKTKSFLEDSQDNVHLSPSRASTLSRSRGSYEKSRSLSSHPPAPRLDLPDFSSRSLTSSPPTLSAISLSTTSSSPSSRLFDKDLFDAFPSVPEDLPSLPPAHASSATLSNTTTRSSSQTIRNS